MGFGIYEFYRWFQPGFRQKRTLLFLDTFHPDARTRILDVGGLVKLWHNEVPIDSPVTCLNPDYYPLAPGTPERYRSVKGDGCKMDFPDRSFDIVCSNSTIEHVRDWAEQRKFAAEIRRVGRQYFVQTPNRWFFIEPHFIAPFIHFLPRAWSRKLLPWLSLRALMRHGDNRNLKELAEELRLLSYRELKILFPDAEIYREKWFGFTKSFTAIRRDA
jgi:SAM-dependent methyltransferase